MRGRQMHLRRGIFFMRLQEAGRAQAPPIPGLQPGEPKFWARRGQVIAKIFRQGQKFSRHDGADRVLAAIFWPGIAAAIAIKSGHRGRGTGFKFTAQDIYRWRAHFFPLEPEFRGWS